MMPVFGYFMALTLTSALGGLGGWMLNGFLLKMTGISFMATVLRFAFCGAAAFVIFYVACLLLGIKEAREYLRRFTRG
jgi:hypothetical protein